LTASPLSDNEYERSSMTDNNNTFTHARDNEITRSQLQTSEQRECAHPAHCQTARREQGERARESERACVRTDLTASIASSSTTIAGIGRSVTAIALAARVAVALVGTRGSLTFLGPISVQLIFQQRTTIFEEVPRVNGESDSDE
jgi:hypothetical protein